MEIFMRNVPLWADDIEITLQLEQILHSDSFQSDLVSTGLPMNFKVFLKQDKHDSSALHYGLGTLTLPSEDIGNAFLKYVEVRDVVVDEQPIYFEKSAYPPRPDILGEVQLLPYRDPRDILAKEARDQKLSGRVWLRDIQFGWRRRDHSFSIEWRSKPGWLFRTSLAPKLTFDDETREIRVEGSGDTAFIIAIRYSRILSIEMDNSNGPYEHSILMTLESAPSYEMRTLDFDSYWNRIRHKVTHLDDEHERVAPFSWRSLRLVCLTEADVAEFARMAEVVGLKMCQRRYPVFSGELFGPKALRMKEEWLGGSEMPWRVAFQCEALHSNGLVDTMELLSLSPSIDAVIDAYGADHAENVLRKLKQHLYSIRPHQLIGTVSSCFTFINEEILQGGIPLLTSPEDSNTFRCFHVIFTSTAMMLRGPFPDTSNRIIRRYHDYQHCFLRVSFVDDGLLKFRFRLREVDGPSFIDERVGGILREGFSLCGRHFEFLAYSQSALKQYSMWFVTPFETRSGWVDADTIRDSIGSEWPVDVRRCPARFAARLSQAFTATESSIFVELDQVERIPDIERNGFCFSDGNGIITQEMAEVIHDAMQRNAGRANRVKRVPSVFQVRIQGAKGILSVDSQRSGMKICLRPSMVKFESRGNPEVEIARVFNKPGKFFLNKALIMILTGLGVDANEFLKLQRDAIVETETLSKTMQGASRFLEAHGLGTAFALPSTLTNLHKLGLDWKQVGDEDPCHIRDSFTERSMQYAVNHVLREMKYRCRIPVPMSFKLVGVVDVHKILEPQQIYVCIAHGNGTQEYLRGPVVISKSPTIHPGDIQLVSAIGKPPDGSPLKALVNCVVFSQRGDRPLPDKLSGSDLDGDEYDLILLPSLRPPRIELPSKYPPAPRMRLRRDSTIEDVAEFVVDFINSDMLGIIANNFLLIADRHGIFHEDCLMLAQLHSLAVDFPKSGAAVPYDEIPQPEIRIKPDWSAPEVTIRQEGEYYESQSVLGKLFRRIHLPKLSATGLESWTQQRQSAENCIFPEISVKPFTLPDSLDDIISVKLRHRLQPLVNLRAPDGLTESTIKLFVHFVAELDHICISNTFSRKPMSRLTEEEVFIGTIVSKSSQPGIRKDMISRMREETTALVRQVHKELEGGEDATDAEWINRAWAAWQVSVVKRGSFGASSFGWVALRALFDGMKHIDDEK